MGWTRGVMASVVVLAAVGCAGSSEEPTTSGAGSAMTGSSPLYDALVGTNPEGTTYRSGGTSDCGHVLTLQRGNPAEGTGSYAYNHHDCELGDRIRSRGAFKITATGILALNRPSLQLTPDDGEPAFGYTILRAAPGGPGAELPEGTMMLESSSAHQAILIPEGFVP